MKNDVPPVLKPLFTEMNVLAKTIEEVAAEGLSAKLEKQLELFDKKKSRPELEKHLDLACDMLKSMTLHLESLRSDLK